MPRFDDPSPDSGIDAALAVIDATLAGEAVEPEQAELAELTLILAGERPAPREAWAQALDERVAARFAPRRAVTGGGTGRKRRRRRWLYAPGAAVGLAGAVAAVVVLLSSGGGSRPLVTDLAAPNPHPAPALPSAPRSAAAPSTTVGSAAAAPSTTAGSAASGSVAVAPPTSGRQVVQAAQLSLSTRPDQVDDVAQQVFDVVSAQNGVVENSTVTASNGSSGYAQFQLSVPSDALQQTMSALSRLHGASVASRTDASQDITGQVGGAGRRLADARALRTSLLRQLANATTQQQINSLRVQIRDAEASISSDQATLRSLHHKVDNSQISVTVNAAMVPGHPVSHGGFTIGRAAHDAGRVLVVAAGGALIALAVLVPLSLVAALALWLGSTLRRRRREQALDLM